MDTYQKMNTKTKEKIKNSFIELLQEKPFTKISIQSIAAKADINRGTFYLHYLDKYDLLEQLMSQLLASLERHLNHIQPAEVLKAVENGDVTSHSIQVFSYIRANQTLFRLLMNHNSPYHFQYKFKQVLSRQFQKKIDIDSKFDEGEAYQSYITNFVSSAYLALVEEWIKRDMKESPEELSALYINIIMTIRNI